MRSKRDTTPDPPSSAPEAGDSAERVTISQLPMSLEAASGPRLAYAEVIELPAAWLERLLLLWSELPVNGGDSAVTRAVVDALATMLGDHAVAACIVPSGGGVQAVIRAAGLAEEERSDPTRLFTALMYERVVEIEPGGSTLHVASDNPSCEDERSKIGALIARSAHALQRGLELTRMQARADEAIGELRAMSAHMVQAEKLASLGQIAAGVVHELNNPLTSIVAYTDYLIRKVGPRKDAGEASAIDENDRLLRIAESARRMLRFTRDLVSYARPSSETPAPVAMHMVIDQAIAFCEHVIADARVTVVRMFAPHLGTVRGKPEQLAQIFVNLITNACHAMTPAGGVLTITTREDEDEIHITIADTGHGIQPEHLAQVFVPFFTTKTSGAGTGLGLAIVKSIVDGHGATIRVASSRDQGATFTITLPVWAAARPESRAPRQG
jgi:two-component system NtrC family sensor kinase